MSDNSPNSKGTSRFVVKSSYVWGGAIALVLFALLLSGQLDRTPKNDKEDEADTVVVQSDKLTSVRVARMEAVPHEVTLTVRGRTEAVRAVQVRAETGGRVVALPAEKGTFVEEGDVLCELSIDSREAQLEEARAIAKQRELEWKAAQQLQRQGHRSETQTAASFSAFESAKANLARMKLEFERTKIRAPYAGIFDDRKVEIGDFMQPGQTCGSVVAQDPFLVVGQVSERDVGRLSQGSEGEARLLSGEIVRGHIRYIATAADPATRTFKVELEVDNPAPAAPKDAAEIDVSEGPAAQSDAAMEPVATAAPVTEARGIFRDGITAELFFPLGKSLAHHLSPAILGLDTQGTVGVRIINDDNVVTFVKVAIVADTTTGVWVTGLPQVANVIVVGQELVLPGETVDPTFEEDDIAQSDVDTASQP